MKATLFTLICLLALYTAVTAAPPPINDDINEQGEPIYRPLVETNADNDATPNVIKSQADSPDLGIGELDREIVMPVSAKTEDKTPHGVDSRDKAKKSTANPEDVDHSVHAENDNDKADDDGKDLNMKRKRMDRGRGKEAEVEKIAVDAESDSKKEKGVPSTDDVAEKEKDKEKEMKTDENDQPRKKEEKGEKEGERPTDSAKSVPLLKDAIWQSIDGKYYVIPIGKMIDASSIDFSCKFVVKDKDNDSEEDTPRERVRTGMQTEDGKPLCRSKFAYRRHKRGDMVTLFVSNDGLHWSDPVIIRDDDGKDASPDVAVPAGADDKESEKQTEIMKEKEEEAEGVGGSRPISDGEKEDKKEKEAKGDEKKDEKEDKEKEKKKGEKDDKKVKPDHTKPKPKPDSKSESESDGVVAEGKGKGEEDQVTTTVTKEAKTEADKTPMLYEDAVWGESGHGDKEKIGRDGSAVNVNVNAKPDTAGGTHTRTHHNEDKNDDDDLSMKDLQQLNENGKNRERQNGHYNPNLNPNHNDEDETTHPDPDHPTTTQPTEDATWHNNAKRDPLKEGESEGAYGELLPEISGGEGGGDGEVHKRPFHRPEEGSGKGEGRGREKRSEMDTDDSNSERGREGGEREREREREREKHDGPLPPPHPRHGGWRRLSRAIGGMEFVVAGMLFVLVAAFLVLRMRRRRQYRSAVTARDFDIEDGEGGEAIALEIASKDE